MNELDTLKARLFHGPVKAKNVKFFPGNSTDATSEDMAKLINMFFADPTDTPRDEAHAD